MNEQTGKPKQPDAPTSLIKKAEEIKTLGYRVQTFAEIRDALDNRDKVSSIQITMERPAVNSYGDDSIFISDPEIIHLFLKLLGDALAEAEPVIRAINTPPRLFKLSGQETE